MKNVVTSLLLVLAVGPSGLQTATYGSLEAFLASNGLVKDSFLVKVAATPRA